MDIEFGEDFNLTQTPSFNAGAVPDKKSEGILPVLIRQLHESSENTVTLFGMSFGMVICVAIVRSIERTTTKITFTLEDWTGGIEANFWLEDGDEQFAGISINEYAKVYGCLRTQFGQKTIMIFTMKKVNDPNEILTHNLEMLQARFKAEQFSKRYAVDDAETEQPMGVVPSGLDRKQRLIYEAILNRSNQYGISRNEVRAKFAHMGHDEVDSILLALIQEGHVYSSIDSDHFCNTN